MAGVSERAIQHGLPAKSRRKAGAVTMVERESVTDEPRRDEQGRFLPGHSGNPKGRGPGRPSEEVNALADRAIQAVLHHDLGVLEDKRATARGREKAMDRLARVGARRVTAREEQTQLDPRQAERIAALEAALAGEIALEAVVTPATGAQAE